MKNRADQWQPDHVDRFIEDELSEGPRAAERLGHIAVEEDFRNQVGDIVAACLKIPAERFDMRTPLSRFGVDSIIVTEVMKRISDRLGVSVAPTVFFEAKNAEQLADILQTRYLSPRQQTRIPEPPPLAQPSAVSANALSQKIDGENLAPPSTPFSAAAPASPSRTPGRSRSQKARASLSLAKTHITGNESKAKNRTQSYEPDRVEFEPIAILSMDGAFAQSADLREFEKHLRDGDDCITEIPPSRWDWQSVYGDPKKGDFTRVKYGGFAPDIDKFDPLYFGLSPREAEMMDPQHRMFIQSAYRLLGEAGIAPSALSGRRMGIFIGINLQDYAHMIDRAGAIEALHLTSLGHMFCPNRLSFLLDVHGPSQVIDTACSSSLIAVHRAVLALQHEGCELAIAGGANLMMTPDMHIMYSKVGMICEDGRCKTFSADANGYARGDGVGAVLLKRLSLAERDGDPILAVIRGSAENHGGQSTSLTAPNPRAQASLIVDAHRQAGGDPRQIGYIECHGTGTALGDPIEVNGLKEAFATLFDEHGLAATDGTPCGLGSVKSNIGHAETAAGIAGLLKAVLSLRKGRYYPTLHVERQNPMISLEDSSFFITREGSEWPRPHVDNRMLPRRAGVSSFGAGGSNAHVVVEEYVPTANMDQSPPAKLLFPLSARTESQLKQVVEDLYQHLARDIGKNRPQLAEIAYTLQCGRDALPARIAFLSSSYDSLVHQLDQIRNGIYDDVARGFVKSNRQSRAKPDILKVDTDLATLATAWTQGAEIFWDSLYETRPRRIRLPTYPFSKRSCWIPDVAGQSAVRAQSRSKAKTKSGFDRLQRAGDLEFELVLKGNERFLQDHVVSGSRVLPGAAYLEIARSAAARVTGANDSATTCRIEKVVWVQPCVVAASPVTLSITCLRRKSDTLEFRIADKYSTQMLCQGLIRMAPPDSRSPEKVDLDRIRLSMRTDAPMIPDAYEQFHAMGFQYGPSHQGLRDIWQGPNAQALARISRPDSASDEGYVLDPAILDSVLQSCIGIKPLSSNPPASLPFELSKLEVFSPLPDELIVWVRQASSEDRMPRIDMDVLDTAGQVRMILRGFVSRPVSPATTTDSVVRANPSWQAISVKNRSDILATRRQPSAKRVFLGFSPSRIKLTEHDEMVPFAGNIVEEYPRACIEVFSRFKDSLAGRGSHELLQIVVPQDTGKGDLGALFAGLSGFVATANKESTRFRAQLCEIGPNLVVDELRNNLDDAAKIHEHSHFRINESGIEIRGWAAQEGLTTAVPWRERGVYLISGGNGGLGKVFARQVARTVREATLILCGRSLPDAAAVDALEALGLRIHVERCDVGDAEAVRRTVDKVLAQHGHIDGVLHAAGVLRDSFIAEKDEKDFDLVLPPKVAGCCHLDEATSALDLDFFVSFGSASSILGSAGQADYAAANGFLDAFALWRAGMVAKGLRRGRSLNIAWPLWAEGGMRMEQTAETQMRKVTGQAPMATHAGIAAFEMALSADCSQQLVLAGNRERLDECLTHTVRPLEAAQHQKVKKPDALQVAVEGMLLRHVVDQMGFDADDLAPDAEWSELGFDSITLTVFSNHINDAYGLDVTPTAFFEYTNIRDMAGWMASTYASQLSDLALNTDSDTDTDTFSLSGTEPANTPPPTASTPILTPVFAPSAADLEHGYSENETRENVDDRTTKAATTSPKTQLTTDAIAVIGMSGCYPKAADLEAFWDNLLHGVDCITEVPADRWDWQTLAAEGLTDVKWGGFIEDIAGFDALHFGISRREAALMDPAQRLLMEYVWRAIEDAGYAPASLSGSDTAVIVGTAPSGYGELVARNGGAIDGYSSTGTVGSVGPNRISYLLNLHGPSEPVETACSSALVALHRAVTALKTGDCKQAIVGGVNLLLSPETHVSFSKAGMLSPDGRCKTFSTHANGYVRGEGVGMLFLKPLTDAERDGDHIYGLIRSSAENHGGKAHSLTAPNPLAQAALIEKALRRAGVSPSSLSYIETHGTGTELGDPIEIQGLKRAFDSFGVSEKGTCAIGSVKTNIGHLELAAGVAGIQKVLLQLKHKTLVPSLHCDEVNPYLKLDGSPFRLLSGAEPWIQPTNSEGRTMPLRAGVSSFGFGGVNAHVIVEEYPQSVRAEDHPRKEMFLLSARDGKGLQAAASLLHDALAKKQGEATSPKTQLNETLRDCIANILQVSPDEIATDTAFSDIGLDPIHRPLLRQGTELALGVELPAAIFHRSSCIDEISDQLTQATDVAATAPYLLRDIAFTLRVGRNAMKERVAFFASSHDELIGILEQLAAGQAVDGAHYGRVSHAQKSVDALTAEAMAHPIETLAQRWVDGVAFDWDSERKIRDLRRVPLPGYPFAKEQIWFNRSSQSLPKPEASSPSNNDTIEILPDVDVDGSYAVKFAEDAFFIRDHKVGADSVLPGVAYLEIARRALADHTGEPQIQLSDIVWLQPAYLSNTASLRVRVSEEIQSTRFRFQVVSHGNDGHIVHCQGSARLDVALRVDPVDLTDWRDRITDDRLPSSEIYKRFSEAGLEYGPGHQSLDWLVSDGLKVLARVTLPAACGNDVRPFVLHPSLMDGALQAVCGFALGANHSTPELFLPFAIEELKVFAPNQKQMWVVLQKRKGGSAGLQKIDISLCDETGNVLAQINGFTSRRVTHPVTSHKSHEVKVDANQLKTSAQSYFRNLFATSLDASPDELDLDEPLDSYGLDSFLVTEIVALLEKDFGTLSKTLLFEYQTINELIDYFAGSHEKALRLLSGTQPTGTEPDDRPDTDRYIRPVVKSKLTSSVEDTAGLAVAIVGLSGRYPAAYDLQAYWENLRAGRDCISEIPSDRWAWEQYFSEDDTRENSHLSKWGGFIDDVAAFDPLFFQISPAAVEAIDPQERLFLEHAWMAMEDAGYRREDLQNLPGTGVDLPGQVGVYAGVMYGEYQLLGLQNALTGNGTSTASYYAGIANRVSYALNVHGPSMAVDTMCSSALTAIHLACADLALGRTQMAFAGAVNLNLHPNKYSLLSRGKFLSSSGRCKSFGVDGDGYVPAEGVGVVVLKRLADAVRDGDHIYGVIKGSALNHGGRTNGYTVPNPVAQYRVIARALHESAIDPRAIGYIEAHGTGTSLGDPIEFEGLCRGYGDALRDRCWIGSSKSNIGHGEAVAGMAGLTKVLLQLKAGEIAPSLHADAGNPNIDFENAPFRVNTQLRSWDTPVVDGESLPRAAAVSSFGAGGSNAHLVIEEYIAPRRPAPNVPAQNLIVLSAKSPQQLRSYAEALCQWSMAASAEIAIQDVAYTLQTGREAMPHRLGLLASSLPELAQQLRAFLDERAHGVQVGRAAVNRNPTRQSPVGVSVPDLLAGWMQGVTYDWDALYAGTGRRVSLPTYPFAREIYWPKMAPLQSVSTTVSPAKEAPVTKTESGSDLVLCRPRWETFQSPSNETKTYGLHRVVCTGTIPTAPGIEQIVLPQGISGDPAAFTEQSVVLLKDLQETAKRNSAHSVLFQLVVTHDSPFSAALAGMLDTASREIANLTCQTIELDSSEPVPGNLPEILRQAASGAPQTSRFRLRANALQYQYWCEETSSTLPVPQRKWRENGRYLIAGGAGGLGTIVARHLAANHRRISLVLSGRSPLGPKNESILQELRSLGANVTYAQADLSDEQSVREMVAECLKDGPLHGVIHSGGVLADRLLLRKSEHELRSVFSSKVTGAVNLDRATHGLDLDLFVLFSSIAGAMGNPGQADYATANAYLDIFAQDRNQRARLPGGPSGQTVSIAWPYWADGGMRLDAESIRSMRSGTGLVPLSTQFGLQALDAIIAQNWERALVLEGERARIHTWIGERETADDHSAKEDSAALPIVDVLPDIESHLTREIASLSRIPESRLERDVQLVDYGFDSVALMTLTATMEKKAGPLPQTLFFEHPTIQSAAQKLLEIAGAKWERESDVTQAPEQPLPSRITARETNEVPVSIAHATSVRAAEGTDARDDIAIIGMTGRYPDAPNINRFWENLVHGRDCITEIPKVRWDIDAQRVNGDEDQAELRCIWGGFLDDVDAFDARFFQITPSEAELLDPQERLFLENTWQLLESTGYLGEALRDELQGEVGVFAGSMSQQYPLMRADIGRESLTALSSPSSIANRVSYAFDLQGPSVAVDTMCSSGLVAIHMACESLRNGDCRAAVAGGVNVSIHPKKYIGLSISQMVGSSPTSRSFRDGDGYLPAEGVGAVLLRPLKDAEAAGDQILAVIKATGFRHGGKSSGYRVPSVDSQAKLLKRTIEQSEIDPRTITYAEAAANGSALADSIELAAFRQAFEQFTDEKSFCAMGAVKSNIGHAEAASGMSQLAKVVMQLQNQTLVPTIHTEDINPRLDFESGPFRLQRELQQWQRPRLAVENGTSVEHPLRAIINAVGAGGTTACMVVEEYSSPPPPPPTHQPKLFLLSAKDSTDLRAMAADLRVHLLENPGLSLDDVSFTLQTGRMAMEERAAMVAGDRDTLCEQLQALSEDRKSDGLVRDNVMQSNVAISSLISGSSGTQILKLLWQQGELEKLAQFWVLGARIRWNILNTNKRPRVMLPTYPFRRKRYWLEQAEAVDIVSAGPPPERFEPRDPEECLRTYLSAVLRIPPGEVELGRNAQDYGLDSVTLLPLRQELESQCGVPVRMEDIWATASLSALVDEIRTRLPAEHPARDSDPKNEDLPEFLPLTPGQTDLWLHAQKMPEDCAYNVPVALRFSGELDVEALKKACALLPERHPILRSLIQVQDGRPYLGFMESAGIQLLEKNLSDQSKEAVEEALESFLMQPFDLSAGPLMRATLVREETQSHVLLLVAHHIVLDGRSALLLAQDVLESYEAIHRRKNPRLVQAAPFTAFIHWQNEYLSERKRDELSAYWSKALGESSALAFFSNHISPRETPNAPCSFTFDFTEEEGSRVADLAMTLGATKAQVMLAAFALLLHRLHGSDDFYLGVPYLGRPERRFESTLGHFINLLPVRVQLGQPASPRDLIAQVKSTLVGALDHGDLPLHDILSAQEGTTGAAPRVHFTFQNFANSQTHAPTSIQVEAVEGFEQRGEQDLALTIFPKTNAAGKNAFRCQLAYDPNCFSASTIEAISKAYKVLVAEFKEAPDSSLNALSLVKPDDPVLVDWGAGGPPRGGEPLLMAMQRCASERPEHPALICGSDTLRFRELVHDVEQMAFHLSATGVREGDVVAACLERGPAALVVVLATWWLGATHVPLSPKQSRSRLASMLADAAPLRVVTSAHTRDLFGGLDVSPEIFLDVEATDQGQPVVPVPHDPERAAYILFTSGSTGRPKGVRVNHGSLLHHIYAMSSYLGLEAGDRVLQFSDLSFDASFEQWLAPLVQGACVVMRPEQIWSAGDYCESVRKHEVTLTDIPPVFLGEVLRELNRTHAWSSLETLRAMMIGGESMSLRDLQLWQRSPLRDLPLINVYGPTETTIGSTAFTYHAAQSPDVSQLPIGRPLPGEFAFVTDCAGQPLPVGLSGELTIGGVGVADGYMAETDPSRSAFLPDPFSPGQRVYRTGDLARWSAEGQLEFLGRLDGQVSIRGFRVEIAEVENAFLRIPGILQVAVTVSERKGDTHLNAHVVKEDPDLNVEKIAALLATHLPDYMRPRAIHIVNDLPKTPGGKLDRRALRAPPSEPVESGLSAESEGGLESELVALWAELLDRREIPTNVSVFELGAHSLLLIRFASEVKTRFGLEIAVSELFQAESVKAQAALIEKSSPTPVVRLRKGGSVTVVLVHGGVGTSLCYRDLVEELDPNFTILGLEALHQPHLRSVPQMATAYWAALKQYGVEGPVHLVGWSSGGTIAWEMAQQGDASGHEIKTLSLIEAYPPTIVRDFENERLTNTTKDTARLFAFADELGISVSELSSDEDASPQTQLSKMAMDKEKKPWAFQTAYETYSRVADAVDRYVVSMQTYELPTLLLHTEGGEHALAARSWPTGKNPTQTKAVAGDHHSILRGTHAITLARLLEKHFV